MSIQASNWAWQQQLAHPTSKFLLVLLADRANENPDYADLVGERHVTWLSVGRMAEKLGVGETTIKSHLNVLEGRGLIRRFARFRENGSRTTNLIILACDETGGSRGPTGRGVGRPTRGGVSGPTPQNHQEITIRKNQSQTLQQRLRRRWLSPKLLTRKLLTTKLVPLLLRCRRTPGRCLPHGSTTAAPGACR